MVSSKKRVIGIFSREHQDLYQWLVNFLLIISVVKDVRQVIITNEFFTFQQEVFKCSFAILYHSKRRGRLNVTDVTDSLYDKELQHLHETFGKKRVLVVIDDLEDSSDNVKMQILNSQQSIRNLAEELFIFSTAEKTLLADMMPSGYQSQSNLKNKLDHMKSIIEGKGGGQQTFPEAPWSPSRKCIIIIGVIIVVVLLVVVLPIMLH